MHEYSTDQDGNHVTQENYIFVDAIENMPRETWATASQEADDGPCTNTLPTLPSSPITTMTSDLHKPEASSATKRSPTRPSSLTKTALFGTMLISLMSPAPSTQMPSANVAGTAAPHPASVEEPQHFYPPDEDDDGRGPRLQCSVCDWFIPADFAHECATCRQHFCYRTCGRFCNGRSGCNLHYCDDCWPSHKEEHHTEDDWSYCASSAEEYDGDVETLSLLQRKISLVDARAAGDFVGTEKVSDSNKTVLTPNDTSFKIRSSKNESDAVTAD